MTRDEINAIGLLLQKAIQPGDDYVVVAVGAHGPNDEFDEGNAIATVRMGNDEATAEAKYLFDAICLARGKIIDRRNAKKKPKMEAVK